MYGSTLIPPWEIVNWFGIDPWLMAGIDHTDDDEVPCGCVLEKPWMGESGSNCLSRDSFFGAIQRAEMLFRAWAHTHPLPSPVIQERQPLRYVFRAGSTVMSPVTPNLKQVQQLGLVQATLVDMVALNKGDGCTADPEDAPDDVFTTDPFPVPDDILQENLHIYLTAADGHYSGTPSLRHEIRGPELVITVDSSGGAGNWTATFSAPAYYFVLPDAYQMGICLVHECATYVDEVVVYLHSLDTCEQGSFVFAGGQPCASGDCDESTSPLCFQRRGDLLTPLASGCVTVGDDIQRRTYCLAGRPDAVYINYIAGLPLVDGLTDPLALDAVAMLAMALVECGAGCCNCCTPRKWEHYRTEAKVLTGKSNSTSNGDQNSDVQYALYAETAAIPALRGLPPLVGVLEAYALVNSSGLTSRISSVKA